MARSKPRKRTNTPRHYVVRIVNEVGMIFNFHFYQVKRKAIKTAKARLTDFVDDHPKLIIADASVREIRLRGEIYLVKQLVPEQ